ncbi:hypothetical protein ACIP1X_16315 [Pseudomonas sp. NPDC088885]|uniref:hypothetical protein n=1 Tax=Pseudomonas sp. NPDC088885 TaxID=3364457 RepID=UPI0037F9AC74
MTMMALRSGSIANPLIFKGSGNAPSDIGEFHPPNPFELFTVFGMTSPPACFIEVVTFYCLGASFYTCKI